MSIECRFGLPLHLLLLALAVCGPAPAVGWRSWLRQRGVVAGVGFLLFVGSCVLLSEATQRSLQKGGRSAFREKRL